MDFPKAQRYISEMIEKMGDKKIFDWESFTMGAVAIVPFFILSLSLIIVPCFPLFLLWGVCIPLPIVPTGCGSVPIPLAIYALIRDLFEKR